MRIFIYAIENSEWTRIMILECNESIARATAYKLLFSKGELDCQLKFVDSFVPDNGVLDLI